MPVCDQLDMPSLDQYTTWSSDRKSNFARDHMYLLPQWNGWGNNDQTVIAGLMTYRWNLLVAAHAPGFDGNHMMMIAGGLQYLLSQSEWPEAAGKVAKGDPADYTQVVNLSQGFGQEAGDWLGAISAFDNRAPSGMDVIVPRVRAPRRRSRTWIRSRSIRSTAAQRASCT